MRKYLIDGYNLLHQVADLAGSKTENLELSRDRLIKRLIALTANRRIKVHVIFDGTRSHRLGEDYSNLRVDFAWPSADHYIRQMLSENLDDRTLVAVSSDRKDIGEYARRCGVERMTCQEFWAWLKKPSKKRKRSIGRSAEGRGAPPGWTAQDDAALRKVFEEAERKVSTKIQRH